MSTRQQIASPLLEIAPDALVMKDAVLRGKIQFGSGTIVHPKAIIDAKEGEIHFGANNIVEELALIEYSGDPGGVMEIGNDNLFEVKSTCRAVQVGDNNVFCVESRVERGVEVTDSCRVGIRCQVKLPGALARMTTIHSAENIRKSTSEKPTSQKSQAEFLRRLLPRYGYSLQNASKKVVE